MSSSHPDPKKYRPDIDGIRALAIIPVILFHLNAPFVMGGFIGVDIFFVISGFLIIGIIASDARAGHYTLQNFYLRRARRIFPVLFAILLFLIAVMPFLVFPSEMRTFSTGAAWTIAFLSNFNFYTMDSYFNEKLLTNPLLHTWSLSVEEQFYVLFPLLMFFLRKKFVAHIKAIIVSIFLASFAYCIWASIHTPSAAFYLLPARAWELMLGGILAVGIFPPLRHRAMAEGLTVLGLGLVVYGAVYTTHGNFPGTQALWPCLGTAFLIYAGRGTGIGAPTVSRLLSLYPVRFIGLISYSLYMWHWPLIVISKLVYWPNGYRKLWLLALMFAIAALSWKYIEQPFRTKRIFSKPRVTFGLSAASMAFLFAMIGVGLAVNGAWWVIDAQTAKTLSYLDYKGDKYMRSGECFISPEDPGAGIPDKAKCLTPSGHKKSILLIGDSHAADLWYGLSKTLPDFDVLQATATGCLPLLHSQGEPRCLHAIDYIFNDYLKDYQPDYIILSARWGNSQLSQLDETIKFLAAKTGKLYVIGPTVEYNMALPRVLALEELHRNYLLQAEVQLSKMEADAPIRDVTARTPGATYISMVDLLCGPKHVCVKRLDDGTPLQFDNDHFTMEGSAFVAGKLDEMGLFQDSSTR